MATYSIRVIGDPVLTQRASEVQDIDGKLVQLIDEMFDVMYKAPGIGLAAPQIGVQKRLFVFDSDDDPGVLINPVIKESDDTWTFNEGCLSIPGLYFEIERPKRVLITAVDLDGSEIQREVDELQARMFQHELDHLDGTLMVDHLTDEQRKAAKKHLLDLRLNGPKKGPSITIGRDGTLLGDPWNPGAVHEDEPATGPWHGPAFVVLVLLTVVVLGALALHRNAGSVSSASTASTSTGTSPPTTATGVASGSASGPATTLVSVPGFATPQDYLACVRQSESRAEYTAVSPSGSFFGAYQIDQTTWNNTVLHAGLTSLYDVQPNEATAADQDEVAMALLQWQGTSPWAGDC